VEVHQGGTAFDTAIVLICIARFAAIGTVPCGFDLKPRPAESTNLCLKLNDFSAHWALFSSGVHPISPFLSDILL
jgi:hypothetical protein